MPIVPIVNGGVTPNIRRPRLTINEGAAISGPFPISLVCSETGSYRPGPNNINVLSSRLAITPTNQAPTTYPWGIDYPVAQDIIDTPDLVGYLWVRTVDSNADGYDDLEVNSILTLTECFATQGDNIIPLETENVRGVGGLVLAGQGEMTMVSPLAGIGSLNIAGAGDITVYGQQFIVGTGYVDIAGQGAMTMISPLAGIGSLGLLGSGLLGTINPAETKPIELISQGFETTNIGAVPTNWTTLVNTPVSFGVVNEVQPPLTAGTKSLKLVGNASGYSYAQSPVFTYPLLQDEDTGELSFIFKKAATPGFAVIFARMSSGQDFAHLYFDNLATSDNGKSKVYTNTPGKGLTTGVYHLAPITTDSSVPAVKIKFIFNKPNKTYQIWIKNAYDNGYFDETEQVWVPGDIVWDNIWHQVVCPNSANLADIPMFYNGNVTPINRILVGSYGSTIVIDDIYASTQEVLS